MNSVHWSLYDIQTVNHNCVKGRCSLKVSCRKSPNKVKLFSWISIVDIIYVQHLIQLTHLKGIFFKGFQTLSNLRNSSRSFSKPPLTIGMCFQPLLQPYLFPSRKAYEKSGIRYSNLPKPNFKTVHPDQKLDRIFEWEKTMSLSTYC